MKNADEGSETIEGTANRSIAGLDKVLRVLSQAARLIRDKGEAVYAQRPGNEWCLHANRRATKRLGHFNSWLIIVHSR